MRRSHVLRSQRVGEFFKAIEENGLAVGFGARASWRTKRLVHETVECPVSVNKGGVHAQSLILLGKGPVGMESAGGEHGLADLNDLGAELVCDGRQGQVVPDDGAGERRV